MNNYESFQWPSNYEDMSDGIAPEWFTDAIVAREIRISDGYATVYTPTDNVTAKPGDVIVKSWDGTLHVVSAYAFELLTGPAQTAPGDPNNAQQALPASPDPAGFPSVEQAVDTTSGAGNPDNAEVEGADAEPDLPPPSSAVLARSARARERYAEHLAEKNQSQDGAG